MFTCVLCQSPVGVRALTRLGKLAYIRSEGRVSPTGDGEESASQPDSSPSSVGGTAASSLGGGEGPYLLIIKFPDLMF